MGGAVSSGRDNDELIDNLMSGNYIRSKEVERVFRALDRAEYMTPEAREQAYKDLAWRNGPLHLSSPCIYSEVMEGLELKPGLSFLNVGSGTGYLSTLAGLILGTAGISHGVEVHPAVVEYATKKIRLFFENSPILDDFDFCEPKFYHGNGLCLDKLESGYDRVYCGAGCPEVYENYFKRLIKVGGILVMPLNDTLLQVRRVGEDKWTSRNLLNVSFATLRIPTAEEVTNKVKLDQQTPVRLLYLARASIRESMRGGVTRRHPELREAPRPPPPAACPRRICIPLEPGGEVEGLNVLHDLDSDNGANEMNALLSLVISMGQSRVAGALRFDRLTPSDSEDENSDNDDAPDQPDPEDDPQDSPDEANDNPDNHPPDNDHPDNHNRDNNNQDNHNQDNDDPEDRFRGFRRPAEEHFPDDEDPGSRRLGEDELNDPPRIPRNMGNGLLGDYNLDSDDEDLLRKTFDNTLRQYTLINSTNMSRRRDTDRGGRKSNTGDTRPDDPDNTANTSTSDNKGGNAESEAGKMVAGRRPTEGGNAESEAGKMVAGRRPTKGGNPESEAGKMVAGRRPTEGGNAESEAGKMVAGRRPTEGSNAESEAGKMVDGRRPTKGGNAESEAGKMVDGRRPANSTDEDKAGNSRKSGRTRSLFGAPRDPMLMSLYENDARPSTSSDQLKSSITGPLDQMVRDTIENYATRGPNSAPPRPDLPGMPSEVEIDLGKVAATTEQMVWEESRSDAPGASEEDTDTSNSKPKRQKLDSGIGEATPSGSSPEKTKSENSDSDSPLHSDCPTEDADGSRDDSADRLGFYVSDSEVVSDSPTDETEGFHDTGSGGSRSPSYWSESAEELAHRERMRRRISRGGDARRVRLSYLMKQAVRELPLPHALKKFVNLGRCFEF